MVPKFRPSLETGSDKHSTMESDDLGESSNDENSSYEGSIDESQDDGDDFLEQVKTSSSNKRKMNEAEDDAEENTEENENEGQVPSKKKKKKKKSAITDMKPPTAEEMIRLRETENLFHSNLFRMQIEEMIKEVRPKKSERKQMKLWLESLKALISNLKDSEKSVFDIGSLPTGVIFPLPLLPKESKSTTIVFLKPEDISVTGSYSAGCSLGPSLSIDVVVTMPKKCFLNEDYLNARYHQKRALYLSYLASKLSRSDLVDQQSGVSWTLQGSNCTLSPRLVLHPSGKTSNVTVYVSAVPQANTFKLTRFTPTKNNVRESWLTSGATADCRTPTPIYNTSVMRDLVSTSNENVRHQTLENHNNLKDAIALLRVWLKQRQLDQGPGGFSGYLVSMLVVALFMSRQLNALMSSYQIIRNVWLFLDQTDWMKEGFSMCSTKKEANTPTLEEFHSHFDVVFVDVTGYCNIAASIHRLTYLRVKQEAKLAMECLDNPNKNNFQALFMISTPFLRQFDCIICIKKPRHVFERVLAKESTEAELINNFATKDSLFTAVVTELLMKGVGGRVDTLTHQLAPAKQWPIQEIPPMTEKELVIGLRLNVETAFSVVEKGPPANEPEAAEFRALWGDRCELRRFRDGLVCEAVVWAEITAPLCARRLITQKMCEYLLTKRLILPEQCVTYLADQLEPLVTDQEFEPYLVQLGTGEEASNVVVHAFDRLAKQLRELPDLPLEVAGIQGVSAVFRGAEVFPQLARLGIPKIKASIQGLSSWLLRDNLTMTPEYIQPVEGVMQLGLSRKWPEDPEAVRRVRAAFNLHIAKAMLEKYDVQTQAHADFVDIFKEGFVFRIRISYPREVSLLKESKTPDGKICYRDTQESLELEKNTVHLPKLTGALHGLQQQFPAASVVCRLAKRWLSSQLLDTSHVPDVAVELLVASLFLDPEPFRALTQPQPMFLRFLQLLASHNWHLEPVIVNFNNDLKREDLLEIESTFRTERATLPPMVICTQYDKSGSVWTREAPLLPVLVRLANLAKQSLDILEINLLQSALLERCKLVFRPPLELYDALIKLKPIFLPRIAQGVDFVAQPRVQLKAPEKRTQIPITGFDPAQCYLQELRDSFSDYALFFHDTYGGTVIGVLFKPSVFEKREFKVSHVNCRKPTKDDKAKKTMLSLNFSAIIEDFYTIGATLVRTIELSPKCSSKVET